VNAGFDKKIEKTMANARLETETALNVCIQHVLDRTGIKPAEVKNSETPGILEQ
jgi:hypothetical protein